MRIDNAIIRYCDLMIEDHGYLILDIAFDYGGSVQGWPIILGKQDFTEDFKTSFSLPTAIMWVTGKEQLSRVAGAPVRVVSDRERGIQALFPIIGDKGFRKTDTGLEKISLRETYPEWA